MVIVGAVLIYVGCAELSAAGTYLFLGHYDYVLRKWKRDNKNGD